MKSKLKQFYLGFSASITIETLFFLVFNAFMPDKINIRYLRLFCFMGLIVSICGTIVFKTGVSLKSMWIRRAIMFSVLYITTIPTMVLFHFITYESFGEFALFTAGLLVSAAIISVIAYLIADKAEKKMLARINEKLNDK